MAGPAAVGMIAKAIAALSDEHARRRIGWVIAGILSPILLLIVLILSLLSAAAAHNSSNAVELCFRGGAIPVSTPSEYREYIEDMRSSFELLDSSIEEINSEMEDESLDNNRVKAIFMLSISEKTVLPTKIISDLRSVLSPMKSAPEL